MKDWHVFMWKSLKILNVFNTLTLKPILSEIETFFKKLMYCFLVESTRIEKVTFPYKTGLSKANVKTNRMGSTIWTFHKELSFASFWKILFQFKNLVKRVNLMYQPPNVHIYTFRKHYSYIWGCFSLWVSLKISFAQNTSRRLLLKLDTLSLKQGVFP